MIIFLFIRVYPTNEYRKITLYFSKDDDCHVRQNIFGGTCFQFRLNVVFVSVSMHFRLGIWNS